MVLGRFQPPQRRKSRSWISSNGEGSRETFLQKEKREKLFPSFQEFQRVIDDDYASRDNSILGSKLTFYNAQTSRNYPRGCLMNGGV